MTTDNNIIIMVVIIIVHLDAYWGDGADRKGLNQLGQVLMTVREDLAKK